MPASGWTARRSSEAWEQRTRLSRAAISQISRENSGKLIARKAIFRLRRSAIVTCQQSSTRSRKPSSERTFIIGRLKDDWPTGKLTQLAKIRPSDCDAWLARYRFGSASRNLHISCLKELFALAVRDRIITASPAAHLFSAKPEKPIRLTPTFEQFKAVIADVRAQPFNADAQDSADFLEFLGLAGLGQAEAAPWVQRTWTSTRTR